MAFDVPIGDLTRLDLSNDENVKQARFELERCRDDHQFARWARTWGESAMRRLDTAPCVDETEEYQGISTAFDDLTNEADEAADEIGKVINREDCADSIVAALAAIQQSLSDAVQAAKDLK